MKTKSRCLLLGTTLAFSMLFAAPAFAAVTYPTSMAVMGDSIATAWGAEGGAFDFKEDSFATGDAINSFAVRLANRLDINPDDYPIQNLAAPGSVMESIDDQAADLNSNTKWVVLNGLNTELCGSGVTSVDQLKPPSTAQQDVKAALDAIKAKASGAQIYVVSIPNWYDVWKRLHGDSEMKARWNASTKPCPLLFGSEATQTSRTTIGSYTSGYNSSLRTACRETEGCRFDGSASYNTVLTKARLSTWDGFHPSVAGQQALAANSWIASPWSLKSQGIKTHLRELSRRRVSVTVDATANASMEIQFRESGELIGKVKKTMDAAGHLAFTIKLREWRGHDLRIKFIERLDGEKYSVKRTLNS